MVVKSEVQEEVPVHWRYNMWWSLGILHISLDTKSSDNARLTEKHATKSIINRRNKTARKRRPLILAGSTSEPALGGYVCPSA